MNLKKIFICIIIINYSILSAFANTPQKTTPKKWAVTLEAGNGSLIGLTAYYRINKIGFGIGTGFDYSNETVEDEKYTLLLFSGTVNGIYHFLGENIYQIDGRLKVGYNYLSVDDVSASGYEITPEILLGYKNFYAILSGVILFTKETLFIPQIGAGYRFRF